MRACIVLSVLLLMVCASAAKAENFGAWSMDYTNDKSRLFAATVNDSGNVLGEFCSPDKGDCVWMLALKSGCESGAKYPVLANSDSGAVDVVIYCGGKAQNGLFRYLFSDFKSVDHVVKKSTRIGFAIPLQSDNFRVVRFDLRGANRAISLLRKRAKNAMKHQAPSRSRNTKDQIL